MPSSHLILCCPFFLLFPIPPSIRVFSNESTLHMRWPKYWSFSFSIIPSKEIPGLISFRMDWWVLQSKGLSKVFSNTTVQKHQFFGAQLSFSLSLFCFVLFYNTVLALPYIDMNPPWVYMSSHSWTSLPPPTPYHLSGSSPCTSPELPVSCIEHRLAIRFLHDSIHVSAFFTD